jgi:hypothetical protein
VWRRKQKAATARHGVPATFFARTTRHHRRQLSGSSEGSSLDRSSVSCTSPVGPTVAGLRGDGCSCRLPLAVNRVTAHWCRHYSRRVADPSSGARTAGQLKQEILRIYNAVNQQISGVGVSRQRVDLLDDRILIVAEHQRVRALASLDDSQRDVTRAVDVALVDESKRRLAVELRDVLGLSVRVILKDYDPVTQLAATVVILDGPLPVDVVSRRP